MWSSSHPFVSTTPSSRNSSLSQHTFVFVMNQEKRHALLSNVHMTNWAFSFADCPEVSSSLNRMSENVLPTATCQKEESAKSISDKHPHGKLLNTMQHVVAHGDVNAHHALEFGETMVKWFRKSWHSRCYDTFSEQMVTIVLCGKMLYDQKRIYESIIVLMPSNRSVPKDTCMVTDIVDLGATVQKNRDTTKTILVMLALSGTDTVTATYNVNKQLARKAIEQPTQKSYPSLVTFKPILMKYAAQQYGCETVACKGAICMFSLFDCTVVCACESGSSCLQQLTKRSWRRLGDHC